MKGTGEIQHQPETVVCKYGSKFGDTRILDLWTGEKMGKSPLQNANH